MIGIFTGSGRKRPPNSTWTDEREEQLRELYDDGTVMSELASIFGLCPASIQSKLRQLGYFGYVKSENKKAKAVEKIIKKSGWKKELTLKDLDDF